MEVLGTRVLLVPKDLEASQSFYRDVLGLAVAQEWGDGESAGVAFFTGGGVLEVTPNGQPVSLGPLSLWFQVRDLEAEHRRLRGLGVEIRRPPLREEWGLDEMWIADPDGVPIVLTEIPPGHPMRRLPTNTGAEASG
jgi:catechol 2,3-dioxygenase-like lactoylglutathione lyase family enzyme